MNHALAAAQLTRAAALHLGATDDRAGYWRLLGEADLCLGRSAEWALQLATRHELGLVTGTKKPPTKNAEGQVRFVQGHHA